MLLQMKNICKSFFHVEVLHHVDFDLRAGEIHALIGENGAGKSTLMKVLMGEYAPDEGEILLEDQVHIIPNPSVALSLGISKVHQELSPVRDMTVADNIFLGREIKKAGFVESRKQIKKTKELFANLGLSIDPNKLMRELSVAETQMVEIAKAVSFNCKILILDEPTTAITSVEIVKLFEIVRLLREKGVGIVYISHKLEELYEISDRITVLRDGSKILTDDIKNVPHDKLIHAMVGREITDMFPKINVEIGQKVMEVRHISRKKEFEDISFDLHAGEVLGLAGLMGAGRTEVCRALFGASRLDSGEVRINGEKVSFRNPRQAIQHKMAMITEDRKLQGLNLIGSVEDNMVSVIQRQNTKFGFVRERALRKKAEAMKEKLHIKVHSLSQKVSGLSGGNQQKVVIAKWGLTEPEIIIFDEPTRGIDVGAKTEIYKLIGEFASQGKAVLMVSSEMPEILGLCDRVLVLHEGKLTGSLTREEMTQEKIMTLAAK